MATEYRVPVSTTAKLRLQHYIITLHAIGYVPTAKSGKKNVKQIWRKIMETNIPVSMLFASLLSSAVKFSMLDNELSVCASLLQLPLISTQILTMNESWPEDTRHVLLSTTPQGAIPRATILLFGPWATVNSRTASPTCFMTPACMPPVTIHAPAQLERIFYRYLLTALY